MDSRAAYVALPARRGRYPADILETLLWPRSTVSSMSVVLARNGEETVRGMPTKATIPLTVRATLGTRGHSVSVDAKADRHRSRQLDDEHWNRP